jgi:hypothetical protein
MSDAPSLIMIQFLSWVADRPRTYAQTMEAWRTTCPRLSVWEDAVIDDLVRIDGELRAVSLTPRGHAVLRKSLVGKYSAGASDRTRRTRSRQAAVLRQRV